MTKEKKDKIIGNIAATLTTASFIPGAIAVLMMFPHKATGINLAMYIMLNVGILGWLWYGKRTSSQPVILANAITLPFTLAILLYKLYCG